MRYLYADSELFPPGYDFLTTLKLFLEHGGLAAHHLAEMQEIEEEIASGAADVASAVELITRFGTRAEAALGTVLVSSPRNPAVQELADALIEEVQNLTEAKCEEVETKLRQDNSLGESKTSEHRAQMHAEMAQFFLKAELGGDLLDARIELRDGKYAIEATRWMPGDISVTYAISADRFGAWSEPRKVASITDDLEKLQVGMKKKFLRRDLTREMIKVADHTIVSVILNEEGAEIALAKRPEATKDVIQLHLAHQSDGVYAHIERPSADEGLPFPAVPSDVEKLSGLWAALEEVGSEALEHRSSVLAIRVDDVDVLELDEPGLLLDRLIEQYGPIVREITRRSPSPRELSLKVEHEDGRREERYISRDSLTQLIEGLNDEVRARFATLEI